MLIIRDAGLYIEKARLLPGFDFLTGADAVIGMMNKAYYGGSRANRDAVFEEFRRRGTRLYVGSRKVDDVDMTVDDVDMPRKFGDLFVHAESRADISSSDIRKRGDR